MKIKGTNVFKGVMEKSNRGFTLIELMIVVVIIGILTSLSIRQYGNSVAKANVTADFTNAESIAMAVAQALVDDRITPDEENGKAVTIANGRGKIPVGDISGTAEGTVAKALYDGGYYSNNIPEINAFSDDGVGGVAAWYVEINDINKAAVKVYVGTDAKQIQLYPKLTTYTDADAPYNLINN